MRAYQPLGVERSENLELLFKPPVILIFWTMAIDGENMDRKSSRGIQIQGRIFHFFQFISSCQLSGRVVLVGSYKKYLYS